MWIFSCQPVSFSHCKIPASMTAEYTWSERLFGQHFGVVLNSLHGNIPHTFTQFIIQCHFIRCLDSAVIKVFSRILADVFFKCTVECGLCSFYNCEREPTKSSEMQKFCPIFGAVRKAKTNNSENTEFCNMDLIISENCKMNHYD